MTMTVRQIFLSLFIVMGVAIGMAGQALAQADRVWLQLEAHPDLATAETRVRAYSRVVTNVNGYSLRSGWYAIALGPFSSAEASAALTALTTQGLIPTDAYLADPDIYRQQFWPIGVNNLTSPTAVAAVTDAPPAAPVDMADETVAEARNSEAALDRPAREALQIALQWFGHYSAGIDGAFGPGTRGAMTAWQSAMGLAETGILTSRQRALLLNLYQNDLDALGMATMRDDRAGIEIDLPLAMVEFARYEYPFAQFDAVGGSGIRVLLISQQGSSATLGGLYEIMQTLEIVPLEGDRSRDADSFILTGQNERLRSHTEARLEDGQIKGFSLIWPPARDAAMARVLAMMQASFATFDGTLDPGAVDPSLEQGVDLMAGLDLRRPVLARTGFYVDGAGSVVTTSDAVASCTRILVDTQYEMTVALNDPAIGVALLRPTQTLAPRAYAGFARIAPRLRSDIVVAGFPYDGALGAASLNFGTLEALRGLNGEAGIQRLAMTIEASEAGAPVLDGNGALLGMVLPDPTTGRALPEGVSFAISGDGLASVLAAAGITLSPAPERDQPLGRTGLARYGMDLAVLVTCWN
jgi:peptidoglycan hydrolase-like protein with peptidoglycan-binding domain